jgi:dTDP-4-amino-4,6-dideoxygalactose transaminase
MDEALAGLPGVQVPHVPKGAGHVYYQYCVYAPDRDRLVRRALRRGIDVETLHVDVCSTLSLFGSQPAMPGAERAAQVVQLPVYASLGIGRAKRIAARLRRLLSSAEGLESHVRKPRTDIAKV